MGVLRVAFIAVLCTGFLFVPAGCIDSPDWGEADADDSSLRSFIIDLQTADYPLRDVDDGYVPIVDGRYESESSLSTASRTIVELTDPVATGDFDGDGRTDAVVTLRMTSGGSGTFYYLALVLNKRRRATPVASAFIGDRIKLTALKMTNEKILVDFFDRCDGESMSEKPTCPVTRRVILAENVLLVY